MGLYREHNASRQDNKASSLLLVDKNYPDGSMTILGLRIQTYAPLTSTLSHYLHS